MADHKEYWSTESDQGSIRISEDVVASIAALAASETEGVSGLYSSVTRDIVSFLSKKNLSKGVRVELGEEDTVKVEISFLALFGHNICEVAKQVQDNVKSQIESMTGLHVVEINVHVGGVTFALESDAPLERSPVCEAFHVPDGVPDHTICLRFSDALPTPPADALRRDGSVHRGISRTLPMP